MRHYGDITIPLEFWGRDEVYHVTEVKKRKLDDLDIMALRYVAQELFGYDDIFDIGGKYVVNNELFVCDNELWLNGGKGYEFALWKDWIDPETGELLSEDDQWIAKSLYMDKNRRIILKVALTKLGDFVDFMVY